MPRPDLHTGRVRGRGICRAKGYPRIGHRSLLRGCAGLGAVGHSARHHDQTPVYPPERDVSDEPERVGVFICHCGINIGSVVNVPEVVEYVRQLPGVVYAEHNLYTCSQDTQERIASQIHEHGLNRVVVASCTPRTHEPLFQDTLRAGRVEPAPVRDGEHPRARFVGAPRQAETATEKPNSWPVWRWPKRASCARSPARCSTSTAKRW